MCFFVLFFIIDAFFLAEIFKKCFFMLFFWAKMCFFLLSPLFFQENVTILKVLNTKK